MALYDVVSELMVNEARDAVDQGETVSDMKQGVGVKPPVALADEAAEIWEARARQNGNDKYELGNYLRPPKEGDDDVDRLLEYLNAAKRHINACATSIIRFKGKGRGAEKTLQEACYAADKDKPERGIVGSKLPHLAHARTSISMAIQQAVDAGLVPEDPGTPWRTK